MREIVLSEALVARLQKPVAAHKYDHGAAYVLGGGCGRGGAARLAARAALRVGAGLVTLLVPQAALAENAAQLTAIMLEVLPDSFSLRGIVAERRVNAVLLGPALGLGRAREMVPAALYGKGGGGKVPVVLDADALSCYADAPELLFGLLHEACVLTPHQGEFARLFPDLAERPREQAVQAAAERAGCTVLLKGAQTLVASAGGEVALLDATGAQAAPWLATAGSGDVLAGLITGLLARGFAAQEAAELGAALHLAAGRACGAGLIAEDLPEALPKVFAALGL